MAYRLYTFQGQDPHCNVSTRLLDTSEGAVLAARHRLRTQDDGPQPVICVVTDVGTGKIVFQDSNDDRGVIAYEVKPWR